MRFHLFHHTFRRLADDIMDCTVILSQLTFLSISPAVDCHSETYIQCVDYHHSNALIASGAILTSISCSNEMYPVSPSEVVNTILLSKQARDEEEDYTFYVFLLLQRGVSFFFFHFFWQRGPPHAVVPSSDACDDNSGSNSFESMTSSSFFPITPSIIVSTVRPIGTAGHCAACEGLCTFSTSAFKNASERDRRLTLSTVWCLWFSDKSCSSDPSSRSKRKHFSYLVLAA